ncbi:hypothetical protein DVK02_03360 [Halobellus sp. Atlit-31R]|nr:hypothetical protein DVK02_03360 [Halobellus sp. Atlit-31R]
MADLSPRLRGDRRSGASTDGRGRRSDRAQLLLVGALALAVLFVALALLLNTAIYTGNLATREAGVDSPSALGYVSEVRTAGGEAIRSVNYRNNSSHAALNASLGATMRLWDDAAGHHRAVVGDGADADVVGVTNGTRIQQDDAGRNYTSESGAANWTVADGSDLSGLRSLRLTVDQTFLASGPGGDVFRLDVASDAGTRTVSVYTNGGDPEVRVSENGSVTATCAPGSVTGDTFVIDVANSSVGGASCPGLAVVEAVGDDLEVSYANGDVAGGAYTMVVDEPQSDLAVSGLASPGSGSPYWTDALYAADLRVTYRTPNLDYEARIEVVPE